VKSVDGDKNTITFEEYGNDEEGLVSGKTLSVAKGAAVVIDGKPGKLAGLPVGARIDLTLCVDQQTIRSIQAKRP